MKRNKIQNGFTLIELLVVVAIIALLASIIVAGLVDSRGGAKNNKRNELVRQYTTAFALYHGENGSYPESCKGCSDNTTNVCLGTGYEGGNCYVLGAHSQSTNINTQISEFVPGPPPSLESTTAGGHNFQGIAYKCTDSNCINYEMSWILEGSGSDAECFGGAEKISSTGRVSICKYSSIK